MTQVTKCQLTTIQSSSPSDASGGGGARSSTSEVSSRWTHACRQSQVLTGEEKSSCRVEQYATWGTRHGETLHLHLIALTLVITWINKFKNQYIDQIHQIRGEGVVGCGYHNDMMYKNILLLNLLGNWRTGRNQHQWQEYQQHQVCWWYCTDGKHRKQTSEDSRRSQIP